MKLEFPKLTHMKKKEYKVVLITLNYNQNDYTLKCIDSILESNYKNYTILLIDNGSEQGNYNELKSKLPKDRHINLHRIEQNRGYVGGINYGLEKGVELNPDYFLIMNNDTIIDKSAISELVDTIKKFNDKAIVTGKVYHYDDPQRLQDIGYSFKSMKSLRYNRIGFNEIDKGQYDQIAERDMIDDMFWLLPSDLYKKINGYSPYFWFNAEQADFALRAKKVGYKLIYTYKAKLWHKGSVSIGGSVKNPKLAYWNIQSTLIFRYMNLPKHLFCLELLRVLYGIMGTYIRTTLNFMQKGGGDFDYANAKLKGVLYFVKWLLIRNVNTGYNPYN